jgi:hypothetical protein
VYYLSGFWVRAYLSVSAALFGRVFFDNLLLNWRLAVGLADHHCFLVDIAIDYLNLNLAVYSIFPSKIIPHDPQFLGLKFGPLYWALFCLVMKCKATAPKYAE